MGVQDDSARYSVDRDAIGRLIFPAGNVTPYLSAQANKNSFLLYRGHTVEKVTEFPYVCVLEFTVREPPTKKAKIEQRSTICVYATRSYIICVRKASYL